MMKSVNPSTERMCPDCGRVMLFGYLAASRAIFWSRAETKWWSARVGDEVLSGGQFRPGSLSAHRCASCGLILSKVPKSQ